MLAALLNLIARLRHRAPPGARDEPINVLSLEQEAEHAEIENFERQGEQAYSAMYDAMGSAAAGHHNDAKYFFAQAISHAERAGLNDEARRLRARLDHIIAVFRHHQFP